MITRALRVAFDAHSDQKRKYTEDPYIFHPIRVALRVASIGGSEEEIAAALLHDVVEDSDITIEDIKESFGNQVTLYINELTEKFTKEDYPDLNRRERKKREFDRMKSISEGSRLIKIFDKIDNLKEFDYSDNFFWVYLNEGKQLLDVTWKDKCNYSSELEDLIVELEERLARGG